MLTAQNTLNRIQPQTQSVHDGPARLLIRTNKKPKCSFLIGTKCVNVNIFSLHFIVM